MRLFILDSSVLLHDPSALFRFHEHNVFIPMAVLEELDGIKKGGSEVARNARQASRFIDELVRDASNEQIKEGIALHNFHSHLPKNGDNNGSLSHAEGALILQTDQTFTQENLPELPGYKADDHILRTAYMLEQSKDHNVTLVSKDINLRIKAKILGLNAEDYFSDKALDDVDLLHTGVSEYEAEFWDKHAKNMDSWQEEGRTFYRVEGDETNNWFANQFIAINDEQKFNAIVREKHEDHAIIEICKDYSQTNKQVWGINARNNRQNYALNLLMDPEVDFVTLLGTAGTGKTLLALAAGLSQTLDSNLYREIIMTRVTISVGEDIGFLPGTEEEKMTPWMGALMDNLEVLSETESKHKSSSNMNSWERNVTNDLIMSRIKIRSLNFMRGRTFMNRYLIIDEAQNLTSKQMKTLITRAGPGTKIVCLGNVAQIDTPYLTETTSGLTYVVDKFQHWEHSGHVTLLRGERSRLADYASDTL